jgi:hypothetical protein
MYILANFESSASPTATYQPILFNNHFFLIYLFLVHPLPSFVFISPFICCKMTSESDHDSDGDEQPTPATNLTENVKVKKILESFCHLSGRSSMASSSAAVAESNSGFRPRKSKSKSGSSRKRSSTKQKGKAKTSTSASWAASSDEDDDHTIRGQSPGGKVCIFPLCQSEQLC